MVNPAIPRITIEQIEGLIVSAHYFTALQGARMALLDAADDGAGCIPSWMAVPTPELGLLTLCVLVLRNGYKVTGESACASPDLFDADKGRSAARASAVAKIWGLEGYLLKQMLHERNILAATDEAIG